MFTILSLGIAAQSGFGMPVARWWYRRAERYTFIVAGKGPGLISCKGSTQYGGRSAMNSIRSCYGQQAHCAFFGFFRMGELTVPSDAAFNKTKHLTPSNIAVDSTQSPLMLQVHLKKSKTDQEGKGILIYVGKTNNVLCPVSMMLAYLLIRSFKEVRPPVPLQGWHGTHKGEIHSQWFNSSRHWCHQILCAHF